MNDLYNALYDLIETQKTLVLPSEMAARSLMSCYVKDRKKAIAFSSVIAFDTFKKEYFAIDEGMKASDSITRLLFSKDLVENYSDRLAYFIPDNSYEELKERMVYYIASTLAELEDEGRINKEAEKDVSFIKQKYDEFLEKTSYYEPAYVQSRECKSSKQYVLVFAEENLAMLSFYNALRDKKNIEIFHREKNELDTLYLYENEKMEIRNTLLSIKEDVKSGFTLDEIAITTAAYERLRPFLERDSYLLDLPLSFMKEKSALESPASRIFKDLKDIYDTDFDLESLEKFFLSSSYPFRYRDDARRFILNAISMGIKKRGDDNRYRAADVKEIYHDLEHYVVSINETSDPDYLINQIKSLFEKLLDDGQFSNNEDDERVSSYMMDRLISFSERVKEFRDAGLLVKKERLYPLFLKAEQNSIYVSRDRADGVRVYPLSLDVGLHFSKRYVIALNESEARLIKKNISYLSDYELADERIEIDITKNLMTLYEETSDNVIYSASNNTYNGYTLPLTDFKCKEKASMLKDAIENEHKILKDKSLDYDLYPITQKGFLAAKDKSLALKKSEEDVASKLKIAVNFPPSWNFSVSQIDGYLACPFSYYANYILNLSRNRDYKVDSYPYFEIGNILHKAIELYFKDEHDNSSLSEKVVNILDYLLSLWQKRKVIDRNMEVIDARSDFKALSDEMKVYIKATYTDGLIKVIDAVEKKMGRIRTEEQIDGSIASYPFKGFIDCVVEYDDSVSLIDFKTKNAPKDSLQFDIYSYLYKKKYGINVFDASYALIKDGRISSKKELLEDEELEALIDESISSMNAGDFHGVNTESSCKSCSLKGLCRRRFFVR